MELSEKRRRLIRAIEDGLPLVPNPYLDIGLRVGMGEEEVISEISSMLDEGVISRLGVIVRHRKLGYEANAMVVWNVPDATVDEIGRRFSEFNFVTLCYRRPRHMPDWPYNLFCMIHGRQRSEVLSQIYELANACDVADIPRDVLFSRRCFKQRGAVYSPSSDDAPDNISERHSIAIDNLDDIDRYVINVLQDGLGVTEEPFSKISQDLGIAEEELISRLSKMLDSGILSRFGPLFNAAKLGGGLSLAAMKVPDDDFDAIAEKVNSFKEVAHNYARDHELNMWFVLATEKPERLDEVIAEIEEKTGLKVLNLPKIEEFFVGLRFAA